MTPNRKEALECLGLDATLKVEEIEKIGEQLKEKWGLTNLLITRSEEGMSLFEDEVENVPTFAK